MVGEGDIVLRSCCKWEFQDMNEIYIGFSDSCEEWCKPTLSMVMDGMEDAYPSMQFLSIFYFIK